MDEQDHQPRLLLSLLAAGALWPGDSVAGMGESGT